MPQIVDQQLPLADQVQELRPGGRRAPGPAGQHRMGPVARREHGPELRAVLLEAPGRVI